MLLKKLRCMHDNGTASTPALVCGVGRTLKTVQHRQLLVNKPLSAVIQSNFFVFPSFKERWVFPKRNSLRPLAWVNSGGTDMPNRQQCFVRVVKVKLLLRNSKVCIALSNFFRVTYSGAGSLPLGDFLNKTKDCKLLF